MHENLSPSDVKNLIELGAATLYEAAGAKGALDPAIKPIDASMRLAGPAFTVEARAGDNLAIHYAISRAQAGDVLVIDGRGHLDIAFIGDVMAAACQARGIAGMVLDGAARDANAMTQMGFAVFCRGLSIKGPGKNQPGRVQVPIVCAGAPVRPGDIVVGDRDGVVVIDAAHWRTVLETARVREAKEAKIKQAFASGRTTVELLELEPELKRLGYS